MLFESGNPYRPMPQTLQLTWEDFDCRLSAANDAAIGELAEWCVVAYMAADNDLAPQIYDNILRMKSVASNAAMHVCVLFDGPLLTDAFFARLTPGGSVRDDICIRFRELRTNDPATLGLATKLASFYPAKHRLFILSGHGNGWRGLLLDENLGSQYMLDPSRLVLPGPGPACDARMHDCSGRRTGKHERTPRASAGSR